MLNKISIIIPAFNEEAYIAKLLHHLKLHSTNENIAEVIVVDGGSTDRTVDIVKSNQNARIIDAPKGRAKQMNAGAYMAKGDVLYFLHADTFPPKDFDQLILKEINRGYTGCFQLKFSNSYHFLLKLASWFTQFRSLLFRGGDQSLFITKKQFDQLGGFDEKYVVYEDVKFIEEIYKTFPFCIINDYVTTSARRFEKNGVWSLYFHFLIIHIKARFGAPPDALNRYYVKYIS